MAIVREAGGIVRDMHGEQAIFETGSIVAGNDLIVGQMQKVLDEAHQAHAKMTNARKV
jgi:fructose-1,6-bisphosphatase/inositol monophosphatase family enzyme